jgi:hypothetical protein
MGQANSPQNSLKGTLITLRKYWGLLIGIFGKNTSVYTFLNLPKTRYTVFPHPNFLVATMAIYHCVRV